MVKALLRAAVTGLARDESWLRAVEDGPPPRLRRREQARLALWCASRVERFLSTSDRAYGRRLLDAARAALDGDESQRSGAGDELRALSALRRPGGDAALQAMELAAAAVARVAGTRRAPSRVVKTAVLQTARALAKHQKQDQAADFLVELAHELGRLELCGAISRKLPRAEARVRRLVYRGHDGDHARVWVAQLDDGWGVLVRLGRARWTVGARDDVAALIPDRWFAAATRAMISATS